eukprot:1990507-Rhodomonas_salina.1
MCSTDLGCAATSYEICSTDLGCAATSFAMCSTDLGCAATSFEMCSTDLGCAATRSPTYAPPTARSRGTSQPPYALSGYAQCAVGIGESAMSGTEMRSAMCGTGTDYAMCVTGVTDMDDTLRGTGVG